MILEFYKLCEYNQAIDCIVMLQNRIFSYSWVSWRELNNYDFEEIVCVCLDYTIIILFFWGHLSVVVVCFVRYLSFFSFWIVKM